MRPTRPTISTPPPVLADEVLRSQPFSRLLGARIKEYRRGCAVLSLTIREEHRQHSGLVHGGVLAYLCDNAITFAGSTVLGARVLTAGFSIDLFEPAVQGELEAEAHVIHTSGRRATCRVAVFVVEDGRRVQCAAAQGTVVAPA